jgi:hypothetical protein
MTDPDFTLEDMVKAAERMKRNTPDPPGEPYSVHPRQHRALVVEAEPNTDPSDVEYCGECWYRVDDAAVCPECGSSERYGFEE